MNNYNLYMIKFEGVTKTYKTGQKAALKNVNLEILGKEFVFLVGASGSGKSTFLSLVLRQEKPDAGTISVAGMSINKFSNRHIPIYRRKLGVVFQGFKLLETKNVYENVSFALDVIGAPRRLIRHRVPEALDLVGLSGKEDRMPYELSGGEQQRVAIARAFVNKPLVILADEPTGNLDPTTSKGIMKVLEQINKETGTTIVMATHSEEIVNSMKKRVVELANGKIVRDEKYGTYDSKNAAGMSLQMRSVTNQGI
jgi:cell division transport system ATP-binding protein